MSMAHIDQAQGVKQLWVIEEDSIVRSAPASAARAVVGQDIIFDARVLDSFDVKGCQGLHYDLMLLAAALEYADRRWARPMKWRRSIHIRIPVIALATWSRPEVQSSLIAVLRYLTCDEWSFSFVQSKSLSPLGERQGQLVFQHAKTFAMAYSDGLDSRAVAGLCGSKHGALCVRVSGTRQRRKEDEPYFTRIPFKVGGFRAEESSFRTRGFQFAALVAIAAHLSRISKIVVPESGQGALGPVLRPIHKIYRDTRNYPGFFRLMETFVKALLGVRLDYEQPRLWHTKAQTLKAFLDVPGHKKATLVTARSCWQKRRVVNAGGQRQCGLCAACLLRRMSLHAAGVIEPRGTYVIADLAVRTLKEALSVIEDSKDRAIMMEYGRAGARHFQQLAELAEASDQEISLEVFDLVKATKLGEAEVREKLKSLLKSHAEEWNAFLAAQGEGSFLKEWLIGGCDG